MSGFENYLACEASAGSGKTYQLSLRYAALLLKGAACERILCLTFTKKAASEMSVRIARVLSAPQESEIGDLSDALKISVKEIKEELPKALKRFLRSETRIMTIDAFFNRVLRQFALNVGITPNFEIADQSAEDRILAFLKEAKKEGLLNDLAKTTLSDHRSLQNTISIFNQLFKDVVYGRLNVAEPKASELIAAKDFAMQAFNKIAAFVNRDHNSSASARNAVCAATIEEAIGVSKTWLTKTSLSEFSYFKKIFAPELDGYFLEFKTALKEYFCIAQNSAFSKLSKLYQCYENSQTELKKSRGKLGYDDVTREVYKLLTSAFDKEFFYFRMDGSIDHILIDEFQDTSIAQFEILKPLIDEILAGKGIKEDKSFFYVGDQKQSIYRFRGGNPHLFSAVRKLYGDRIKTKTLDVNRRSLKNLIDFVNKVFKDKISDFIEQKPHKEESDGYVEVTSGENVIEIVCDQVSRLLESGVKSDNIAILTRKNDDGEKVAQALREKFGETLSVVAETAVKLIKTLEVRAIIEALKYLYCNRNKLYEANFRALLDIPSDESLKELENIYRNGDRTPLDICVEIARKYALGSLDALRFLEYCATQNSIDELLFNVDSLDAPASPESQSGLKVTTVHKSKGLEFDAVIVMDTLSRDHGGGDRLLFDFEGVELRKIYWRQEGRENVDEQYAQAAKRQKEESKRDDLNALYVSFTRARRILLIAKNAELKKSGEEKSTFAPLELEDIKIGVLSAQAAREKAKKPDPIVVKISDFGRQEIPIEIEKENGAREARIFGTAFHYAIETLGMFERDNLNSAFFSAQNRFGFLIPNRIDHIKERLEGLLNCKEFIALVKNRTFVKEASLVYKGEVMRFDLLVKNGNQWIVIDFKTGAKNPDHEKQVLRYIDALKNATKLAAQGFIAYVRSGSEATLEKVKTENLITDNQIMKRKTL